jgi:hypothetical protein
VTQRGSIAAPLGTKVIICKPADPEAKGLVERLPVRSPITVPAAIRPLCVE